MLHGHYYELLGVSFVESRRFTVSSLANLGAFSYLARRGHAGAFAANHARLYGILKSSCLGGCTKMCRSIVSADEADYEPYVALAQQQLDAGDEELARRLRRSGQDLAAYCRGCNSQLLAGGGEPATHLLQTDLNAQ